MPCPQCCLMLAHWKKPLAKARKSKPNNQPSAPSLPRLTGRHPKPATPAPAGGNGPSAVSSAEHKSVQVPSYRKSPRFQLFIIGPDDVVEFAKLLVFAFLAGFAERLVPDTL